MREAAEAGETEACFVRVKMSYAREVAGATAGSSRAVIKWFPPGQVISRRTFRDPSSLSPTPCLLSPLPPSPTAPSRSWTVFFSLRATAARDGTRRRRRRRRGRGAGEPGHFRRVPGHIRRRPGTSDPPSSTQDRPTLPCKQALILCDGEQLSSSPPADEQRARQPRWSQGMARFPGCIGPRQQRLTLETVKGPFSLGFAPAPGPRENGWGSPNEVRRQQAPPSTSCLQRELGAGTGCTQTQGWH